jgi:hypothetical protein
MLYTDIFTLGLLNVVLNVTFKKNYSHDVIDVNYSFYGNSAVTFGAVVPKLLPLAPLHTILL